MTTHYCRDCLHNRAHQSHARYDRCAWYKSGDQLIARGANLASCMSVRNGDICPGYSEKPPAPSFWQRASAWFTSR